jgi:hypothetical protein
VLHLFERCFACWNCFETLLRVAFDCVFNVVLYLPPELGLIRKYFLEAVQDESLPIEFGQFLLSAFSVQILDSLLRFFVDSLNVGLQFLFRLFYINLFVGHELVNFIIYFRNFRAGSELTQWYSKLIFVGIIVLLAHYVEILDKLLIILHLLHELADDLFALSKCFDLQFYVLGQIVLEDCPCILAGQLSSDHLDRSANIGDWLEVLVYVVLRLAFKHLRDIDLGRDPLVVVQHDFGNSHIGVSQFLPKTLDIKRIFFGCHGLEYIPNAVGKLHTFLPVLFRLCLSLNHELFLHNC